MYCLIMRLVPSYRLTCVLFVADSGDIYSWGMNKDGQLGLGDETSRCTPVLVDSSLVEDCEWDKVNSTQHCAQKFISPVVNQDARTVLSFFHESLR